MLQELLALASVEFYSKEGERIGDKKSLERHICDVTGILTRALQGSPLSNFNIKELFAWQESRETTYGEDKAYLLLGICGVFMLPIYGEGRAHVYKRLREEIDKASKGECWSHIPHFCQQRCIKYEGTTNQNRR